MAKIPDPRRRDEDDVLEIVTLSVVVLKTPIMEIMFVYHILEEEYLEMDNLKSR